MSGMQARWADGLGSAYIHVLWSGDTRNVVRAILAHIQCSLFLGEGNVWNGAMQEIFSGIKAHASHINSKQHTLADPFQDGLNPPSCNVLHASAPQEWLSRGGFLKMHCSTELDTAACMIMDPFVCFLCKKSVHWVTKPGFFLGGQNFVQISVIVPHSTCVCFAPHRQKPRSKLNSFEETFMSF